MIKLTLTDIPSPGGFGRSVAISGDTLVVGATGLAYVFQRDDADPDSWIRVATLGGTDEPGSFGTSVSIRGDRISVGAPVYRAGGVYVYERDAGGADNWGEVAELLGPNIRFTGWAGAVSVGETALVVGTSLTTWAEVFEPDTESPDGWTGVTKLQPTDPDYGGVFGSTVSLSGDTIATGAPYDDGANYASGSVYVFQRDSGGAGEWGREAKLMLTAPAGFENLGIAVSTSGDTLIATAPGEADRGAAYLFVRVPGDPVTWNEADRLAPADEGSGFGSGVSVRGSAVVVAQPEDNSIPAEYDPGTAYVFEAPPAGTGWDQVARLAATDGSDLDHFAAAVSISGNTVVVGAPGVDGVTQDAGAVYIYTFDGGPCGDGLREFGEECDDGNLTGGDGCSSVCEIEPCNDVDIDGDGISACAGDCAPLDAAVYPAAPEINDAQDNQCPMDPGFGAVDELSGPVSFDPTGLSWETQAGATLYEVARASSPDFGTDCTATLVAGPPYEEPDSPGTGTCRYFLVRPVAEYSGSWGLRSDGAERTVSCAP
jgi:cysteine-rich repeat protein